MNKYKKLLKNTFLFGIGTFSSKLMVFLLMPIYTAVLSPDQYNTADLIVNTANLLLPIVALGIFNAVDRFGLDRSFRKSEVFSMGLMTVLCGFGVFLLFSALAVFGFGTPPDQTLLVYMYVFASMLHTVCSNFSIALQKIRLNTVAGILATALVIIFNLVFLLGFHMGFTGYVLATILSDLISTVFLFVVGRMGRFVNFGSVTKSTARAMLRFAIPMIPNSVFWWITNVSDRYMVTWMMDKSEGGLYAIAYKIPNIVVLVSSVFLSAWQMSAVIEKDSKDRDRFFRRVFRSYQSLLFLAGSGIVLLVKPLTRLLTSDSYYKAWEYMPLLVMATVFTCFVSFLGSVYIMARKSKMTLLTTVTGAVTNVVLNWLLIPVMGVNGAALATFISFFTVFVIRAVTTRKIVHIRWATPLFYLNLIILAVQCAVLLSEVQYWVAIEIALFVLMLAANFQALLKTLKQILNIRKTA